ncbi:hypothetical protein ACLB2K_059998 [Fragaria x ananassa]
MPAPFALLLKQLSYLSTSAEDRGQNISTPSGTGITSSYSPLRSQANPHTGNPRFLVSSINHHGSIREDKDLFGGSIQQIQKELEQTTNALKMTRATVDEQTRRLVEHDTKLHDQQTSSFFRSKNNLDKLDEYKDNHDRYRLSLRLLQVED